MSWSIGAKGSKEDVKKALRLQAESPLATYAGKEEATDIAVALDSADRLIDAIELGMKNYEGKVVDGVAVTAYGSHSHTYVDNQAKLLGGTFALRVDATVLEKA